MAPDLSYAASSREGEGSARITDWGMENRPIQDENSFSDKLHQQVITAAANS